MITTPTPSGRPGEGHIPAGDGEIQAVVVEPVRPIFFSGGLADSPGASAGTMKH